MLFSNAINRALGILSNEALGTTHLPERIGFALLLILSLWLSLGSKGALQPTSLRGTF